VLPHTAAIRRAFALDTGGPDASARSGALALPSEGVAANAATASARTTTARTDNETTLAQFRAQVRRALAGTARRLSHFHHSATRHNANQYPRGVSLAPAWSPEAAGGCSPLSLEELAGGRAAEAGRGAGEALRLRLGSRLGHHAQLLKKRGRVEVAAHPSDLAVADVVDVAQLQRDRAARRRDVAGWPS
jgi:hypothetical protein